MRWIGCQRFIYNSKVGEDRYFRTFAKKSLTLVGQRPPLDQCYAQFVGAETQWLREVPAVVLRNGAVRFMQAYSRYFQQLAGRPVLHKKTGVQSVWLTSKLFSFQPVTEPGTTKITCYRLHLGIPKFPVGEIEFTAHRPFRPPASITVSVDAGHWFVSFSNDDGIPDPNSLDTVALLMALDDAALSDRTVGVNRGIVLPLATSTGQIFDFTPSQKRRLAKKERSVRRWQRRLARRIVGSKNRAKAQRRFAVAHRYARDVRLNFSHQTSHALVAAPEHLLFVFEALSAQRVAELREVPSSRQRSGHRRKACTRTPIGAPTDPLMGSWTRTKTYIEYKARRAGKLTIVVPPSHSSQECAACGYTHPDNQPDPAVFVCQNLNCGHTANADHNAARIIARRGVTLIHSGKWQANAKKQVMRMAKLKSVGPERSELAVATPSTPVETTVSRSGGNTVVPGSLKQEPTIATRKR